MLNSKSMKMVWGLKAVLVSIILYQVVVDPFLFIGMKAVFIAFLVLMQVNDVARYHYHLSERHRYLYLSSMILNIAAIGVYMEMFDSVATSIYFVYPLVEVFLKGQKVFKGIVLFHLFVYLSVVYVSQADFESSVMSYMATFLVVYLFREISLEREKGQLLNAELAEAHAKLKEITIVKERTRIAQEMHDSIGHSLIALRMNLEFAENTIETHPEKAGEALSKAHLFSQKSIKELRKAVSVLKDQSVNSQIELEELLKDMIESLQTSGTLHFILNFDKNVESGNQVMNNCIYNSVREAVTNGLKHGKAQQFLIDITWSGDQVRLFVEDNGKGCTQIKKSHGLHGIEERIRLLNGKVSFSSEKDQGFKMLAEIPVRNVTNATNVEVI
ncbi:sensor histidine kinase [Pseudalkalibacillus caeni]|nr:sensor histidine kinase [Pseudalkalibacillus caeni]